MCRNALGQSNWVDFREVKHRVSRDVPRKSPSLAETTVLLHPRWACLVFLASLSSQVKSERLVDAARNQVHGDFGKRSTYDAKRSSCAWHPNVIASSHAARSPRFELDELLVLAQYHHCRAARRWLSQSQSRYCRLLSSIRSRSPRLTSPPSAPARWSYPRWPWIVSHVEPPNDR